MKKIAFLTGVKMSYPDFETHILVDELKKLTIEAEIIPWSDNRDWSDYDLVVIRTTWNYHLNFPKFIDKLKLIESQTKLINSTKIVLWNIHKEYLFELEKSGIPIVPTKLIRKRTKIDKKWLETIEFDKIVVKPAISLGAIGALKTNINSKDAILHANELLENNDVLIQPFVESIYSGEASLLFFDGKFSHAVQKIPKKGEYRVQDAYGGSVEPFLPDSYEINIAEKAIKLVPIEPIYARVDFVNYNNSPHLMELELIEPNIFMRYSDVCIPNFINTLKKQII
ncbi:MAG: hypothetical protein JXL97_11765 [Bacteroidales bacterium]|nr:hypothetical protein [Bacteroidales bacterium]